MRKKVMLLVILIIIVVALIVINTPYFFTRFRSEIIKTNVDDMPGEAPENTYPLIMVHGFSATYSDRISEYLLLHMQNKISEDLNYINKGLLIPETRCAELRYSDNPISIRFSYYEDISKISIEEYSQNLADIISRVKYCTGAEKVDVIAHSMGGVVTRYYIKNIDNSSIRKLIMIASPNHGGLYNFGEIANILPEEHNVDFIQLTEDSEFMRELNSGDETIGDISYYTIAGDIDGKGDGLVLKESVALGGAENVVVECGHILIRIPDMCMPAYDFIKEKLVE